MAQVIGEQRLTPGGTVPQTGGPCSSDRFRERLSPSAIPPVATGEIAYSMLDTSTAAVTTPGLRCPPVRSPDRIT